MIAKSESKWFIHRPRVGTPVGKSLLAITGVILLWEALLWGMLKVGDLDHLIYQQYLRFSTSQEQRAASIWLPGYRLAEQPITIGQSLSNLSGLTWNNQTGTLFMVRKIFTHADLFRDGIIVP